MAGTRLLVITTFLITVTITILLGGVSSILKSQSQKSKWSRFNQPFSVNRRGWSLLPPELLNDDGILSDIEKEINDWSIDLDFYISVVGSLPEENIRSRDELTDWTVDLLADVLNGDDQFINPRIHKVDGSATGSNNCGDLNLSSLTGDKGSKREYHLFIAMGCTAGESRDDDVLSEMDVDDGGNMFLRFYDGTNTHDMKHIISDNLGDFILEKLFGFSLSISEKQVWIDSTSSIHLDLTLVDPNPSSHSRHMSPKEHHDRISDEMTRAVKQSLKPMVENRLSRLLNVTISTVSMPYFGQEILHEVVEREEDDESDEKGFENRIKISDLKEMLAHGDLSPRVSGTVSGRAHEDRSKTLHLISFVAPMEKQFSILDGDTWSYACAFEDKGLVFSVINLNPDNYGVINNEMSEKEFSTIFDQIYTREAQDSISFHASYIRSFLGLPATSMQMSSPDNNWVLNDLSENIGITQWEIDTLLVHAWQFKAYETLFHLKNSITLLKLKKTIPFPIESAMRMMSSLESLQEALKTQTNLPGVEDSTQKLNLALDIAQSLSGDDNMMELVHFSLDQYFAVYGSLLLPLVLPFFKSFIVELKRYHTIEKKKST